MVWAPTLGFCGSNLLKPLKSLKITHCQYPVRVFLQNGTTDFDETLHVAQAWLPEGYGTTGRSGYSPV